MLIQLSAGAWLRAPTTLPMLAETIKQRYRVDRRKIAFVRFIFEAYDGLAIIKTLDPEAGLIEFCIAPGCEQDVEMVIQDLKRDIMMEKAPL